MIMILIIVLREEKMFRKQLTVYMTAVLMTFIMASISFAKEIVVYSARKDHLIKPLFDAYTKETGVNINYITGKAAPLMERLKSEGSNTPADLLITVDAGNLWHAANVGLLQSLDSPVLIGNIPVHLRDSNNMWYGLSVRARTIVYSTDRVKPSELTTYEDLGKPVWKGRLCLRTSKKVYNQSLVAMFIAEHGKSKAESIVGSWVDNLAAEPFSNDTKVMESIVAGQCDVGIVNTYYYGRFQKKEQDLPLSLYWPNQDSSGSGVHVNISGAGVTKHSRNKEEAIRFLEWLSSEKAQNLFADSNMEYPVNPAVKPHPLVNSWGVFRQNMINVEKAGELQKEAIMMMDRAGYR
jgi:iron(III) transport system substrate-binding protein